MGRDPAPAAPRPGEVRGVYCFIQTNGSGNIARGGERDEGRERAAKNEREEVAEPTNATLPSEVNARGWRRGRLSLAAPRARSSAQGGSGPAQGVRESRSMQKSPG